MIVFLPPGYANDKDRRYPVLYALHGYSIGAEQWTQEIHVPQTIEGAFARGAAPMIVVLPDSKTLYGGSIYSSSVTVGDFEKFVSRDLVAYVDAHYRTIADRRARGLAGHSMGGQGTARIGMKHPDVFGSIYIMSPGLLLPHTAELPRMGAGTNPDADQKAFETTVKAMKSPKDAAGLSQAGRAQLAVAAAWSPNPKKPPLYLDLPLMDGKTDASVLARWAANAPLAFIDQYIGNLRQYRAIGLDVGDQDPGLERVEGAEGDARQLRHPGRVRDLQRHAHQRRGGPVPEPRHAVLRQEPVPEVAMHREVAASTKTAALGKVLASVAIAVAVLAPPAVRAADSAAPASSVPLDRSCDRACLYGVLDGYLAALRRKDPWMVKWTRDAVATENNVVMPVGEGHWGTLTKLEAYDLRMADPLTGQVAMFGALNEGGAISPFVVRLEVRDGAIRRAETLVRRKASDPRIMAEPAFEKKPVFDEVIPPQARLPRARLVSIADGYFDTLQLNDGTLFTQFDEQLQPRGERRADHQQSRAEGAERLAHHGLRAAVQDGILPLRRPAARPAHHGRGRGTRPRARHGDDGSLRPAAQLQADRRQHRGVALPLRRTATTCSSCSRSRRRAGSGRSRRTS